jgi:chemotaxis protein MotB
MAAPNDKVNIIIVKKKSGGHAGHHGGAWKVAYADFVTAMMAFFLLLWLLNVTTSQQKQAIANYFDPTSVSDSTSGSGGIMGGQSMLSPGAQVSEQKPVGVSIPLPGDPATENQQGERKKNDQTDQQNGKAKIEDAAATDAAKAAAAVAAKQDDQNFKQAEASLKQAIQTDPDMKALAQNLVVDQTPEGLRIQIVDQEGSSMFASGSTEMPEKTRKLMAAVAKIVAKLPNEISIRGHTDSTGYRSANGFSNWDLSAERANASRRVLIEAGMDPNKVNSVIGKADKDPLFPENPAAPENRRISIVLLRTGNTQAETDAITPLGTPSHPD